MEHRVGDLVFEWDDAKAASNLQKHGVSFLEASTIFGDPLALTIYDPDHSRDEDRFITIGRSGRQRIVAVVSTDRIARIRLVSARRATTRERQQYEQLA